MAVWNMQLGASSEHKDVAAVVRFHQGASIDQFPQWQKINLRSSAILFFDLGARIVVVGGGGGNACMQEEKTETLSPVTGDKQTKYSFSATDLLMTTY